MALIVNKLAPNRKFDRGNGGLAEEYVRSTAQGDAEFHRMMFQRGRSRVRELWGGPRDAGRIETGAGKVAFW